MGVPQRRCSSCGENYAEGVIFCPRDGAALSVRSADSGPDPYLGLTLQGLFRIDALIGTGAVGRVYRAHQLGVERTVALKIMHRDLASNDALQSRFRREARISGSLAHPHLVTVLLWSELEQDGLRIPFLVLEYLDGLSLRSALLAQGALPPARATHILLQIADAVGAAHRRGIVHRDLKPENVMLVPRADDPDFVKVLDFGVARAELTADAPAPTVATRAGSIFGSARYVAPECAAGDEATPASDVYALATIGYELLCGSPPFTGDNAIQVLLQQQSAPVPPLLERASARHIPSELCAVLERNLSKSPSARAPDAHAFALALAAVGSLQVLSSQTQRGHARAQTHSNAPDALPVLSTAKPRPTTSHRTLVILLCFILGAGAALLIATRHSFGGSP